MKKFVLAFVVLAALVAALVGASQAYAQGTTPPNSQGSGYGNGGPMGARGELGVMGGRGARGGNAAPAFAPGDGPLHDGMIAVFAQELGISVEDLNARLAGGETMAQIAFEKGLTAEQFSALMADARSQAIDQAVIAGTLTQEQADWMKTRAARMNGGAAGGRGGRGGMHGRGAGMADCPYYPQTTP